MLGSVCSSRNPAALGDTQGHRRGHRRGPRASETRAVFTIARAHLRGDTAFRSQLIVAIVIPIGVLISPILSSHGSVLTHPAAILPMVLCSFMMVGVYTISTMSFSKRPGALWCVLTSPMDRARFSMASLQVLRAVAVLPFLAATLGLLLAAKTPPLIAGICTIELWLFFDASFLLWRGWIPDVPFSRSSTQRQRAGTQLLVLSGVLVAAGVGSAIVLVSARFGLVSELVSLLIAVISRALVGAWATQQVAQEASALELGGEEERP